MDRFGIQVNKTSRNSVLLMINIGTSRSAVAYLIEVPVKLAAYFDTYQSDAVFHLTPHEPARRVSAGEEMISAGFVTPYPRVFPSSSPARPSPRQVSPL